MNREALVHRLRLPEWSDAEFKEARTAVPKSAYEAASAFANTGGGTIVFGVRDQDGEVDLVGVDRIDKVHNEFLGAIRSGRKLSRPITVAADAVELDGKTLLAFHIPESPPRHKPVYLDGDPWRSFVRRGGCNEPCRRRELERFLRDAAEDSYDSRVLAQLKAHEFFDPASLRWYRSVFSEHNPGSHQGFTDVEFLHERGFVVECGDRLAPTRAAALVLGRLRYVRQVLPRPVIDCQFIAAACADWSPDRRWSDRIVVEENLVQAWLILSERYARHADRPFGLDIGTSRLSDLAPDTVSFREAAINQLIHQDYGDHGRTATIRVFHDRTVFWNSGDAHATVEELLEPTPEEVRNPTIVAAFRRIGLSGQDGTGVRAIFGNWRRLGYVPPVIRNDKPRKAFELVLVREEVVESVAWGGAATRGETPDPTAMGGEQAGAGGEGEAAARGNRDANRDSDQVGSARTDLVSDDGLTKLTARQRTIIAACEVPRRLTELMEFAGVSHRSHFRNKHLKPLLLGGIVRMTRPDNPRSSKQRYVLTQAGLALRASRSAGEER